MIQMICLLSPAFLAATIHQHLKNTPLSGWEFVSTLAIFSGVINMLSTGVVAVLFGHPTTLLSENGFTAILTCKYLVLSFVFALILPHVINFFQRIIRIELSIRVNPEAFADIKQTDQADTEEPDAQDESGL